MLLFSIGSIFCVCAAARVAAVEDVIETLARPLLPGCVYVCMFVFAFLLVSDRELYTVPDIFTR